MHHLLYYAASVDPLRTRDVQNTLERVIQAQSRTSPTSHHIYVETSLPRTLLRLRGGAADALCIDARGVTDQGASAFELLRTLFSHPAQACHIGRNRVWLLVDRSALGVQLAFEAGRARLGGTWVVEPPDDGWEQIGARLDELLRRDRYGKVALCLAGGGIEGLFYELGVLRALQEFLPLAPLQQFDLLCGISAGGLIASLLANGLTPQEIARGLRFGSGHLERIRRRDLFDPNFSEMAQRTRDLSSQVLRGRLSPLQAAFRLPPTGVFAGDRLRSYLQRQLTQPSMCNDFRALPTRLLIGATDQDTAESVLFGSPGYDHVPVHQAVRASTALVPFYAPESIEGRRYVDGSFTRTTNLRAAVQQGATLVVLIDPLVPMRAEVAGHVAKRGGIYGSVQALKSLINSRFDKAYHTLREMYPDVAFHLFQPSGHLLRVMAGSPMKFFFRPEIETLAYRDTLRQLYGWRNAPLHRDLHRHGIALVNPARQPPAHEDDDRLLDLQGAAA